MNPDVSAFHRKFVNEVRRCDEMERKLRYLEKEIKRDDIPILDTGENPDAPQPREMIDLEAAFEKLENELREVNQNSEALKKNYLELTELKHILRKTQTFFDEVNYIHLYDSLSFLLALLKFQFYCKSKDAWRIWSKIFIALIIWAILFYGVGKSYFQSIFFLVHISLVRWIWCYLVKSSSSLLTAYFFVSLTL